MADIAGKLSFEEFAATVRPKSGTESSVEFLIDGPMRQTETGIEPAGNLYIVAVNIPYRVETAAGMQDNRVTFARLESISLTGLEEGATRLIVLDRKMQGTYASFLVDPYPISNDLASYSMSLSSSDPNNPHWFETESIHSDYYSGKNLGNKAYISYKPNYINSVFVDEYDVTIGMAQELRGSTGVWVVRTDVPDTGSISKLVTASIADSYFTDTGIALGHFCGTKDIGEYLAKDIPGFSSASIARREEELKEFGTQRDPAFMYLTGFSGSIIRDEYTDKDVEAGTINFEELKFSRYRVSGSTGDFFECEKDTRYALDGKKAYFENVKLPWGPSGSGEWFECKRKPQQRHLQYFELFTTGSGVELSRTIEDFRPITQSMPGPPVDVIFYTTGSLKLPELCDIVYQPTTGSVYSRVARSMFYVAESNAIYRTDRFGRVYQIDVLTQSGSSEEPTGSNTP